jgi:hypothetical protein
MDSTLQNNGVFKNIDYEAASARLLVVLSVRAHRHPGEPMPSCRLCLPVFGQHALKWSHETRRRRIRDVVALARDQIRQRLVAHMAGMAISANGEGYWLTGTAQSIAYYAAQRRRVALRQLAAASGLKPAIAEAGGQATLFALSPGSWEWGIG